MESEEEVITLLPLRSRAGNKDYGGSIQELKNHIQFYSPEALQIYIQNHNLSYSIIFSYHSEDYTPLLLAVESRFLSQVKSLVEAGADINQEAGDKLPLIHAIMYRKERITAYFLSLGKVEVNRKTKTGKSAICAALRNSDIQLVLTLMKRGAQIPWLRDIDFPLSFTMEKFVRENEHSRVRLFIIFLRERREDILPVPMGLLRMALEYV